MRLVNGTNQEAIKSGDQRQRKDPKNDGRKPIECALVQPIFAQDRRLRGNRIIFYAASRVQQHNAHDRVEERFGRVRKQPHRLPVRGANVVVQTEIDRGAIDVEEVVVRRFVLLRRRVLRDLTVDFDDPFGLK